MKIERHRCCSILVKNEFTLELDVPRTKHSFPCQVVSVLKERHKWIEVITFNLGNVSFRNHQAGSDRQFPPASGKYFYDPTGAITEPLFSAFMRHLRISPLTKERGLQELQRIGWMPVDATYEQVDKLSALARDR